MHTQLNTQNARASSPNPSHSPNLGNASKKTDPATPSATASTSTAAVASTANGQATPEPSSSQAKKGATDTLQSMLNTKNITSKLQKADVDLFLRDWRNFDCQTWHLEPTVRLLSWAGKSIEPYGIDYILTKLGFSHARTTIPKWIQRGFMDPLDSLEALLIIQLLSLVKDDSQSTNDKGKKEPQA